MSNLQTLCDRCNSGKMIKLKKILKLMMFVQNVEEHWLKETENMVLSWDAVTIQNVDILKNSLEVM